MAVFAAEAPLRKAHALTPIAPSDHARGAGTESREHPDQENAAAEARDIAALRREIEQRALPVGPSPAFEMNLLEAESGIDRALARIEASRSHDRDAAALRPDGPRAADVTPPATAPAEPESQEPRGAGAPATPAGD